MRYNIPKNENLLYNGTVEVNKMKKKTKKPVNVQRIVALVLLVAMVMMYISSILMYTR